jgi:cystathionine beta-lyase
MHGMAYDFDRIITRSGTGSVKWDSRAGGLLLYLQGNFEHLVSFFSRHLPVVNVLPLEGTYLGWLDMRGLGLQDAEMKRRLLEAGVWLDEGKKFGRGGEGFQRINIACPRAVLSQALERIAEAFT